MNLHVAEISARVAPSAMRCWSSPSRMAPLGAAGISANIIIVPLPAKCPELNPQENVWLFLRDNWLSNRVFTSYDTIVDHCCYAWNRLFERPQVYIGVLWQVPLYSRSAPLKEETIGRPRHIQTDMKDAPRPIVIS